MQPGSKGGQGAREPGNQGAKGPRSQGAREQGSDGDQETREPGSQGAKGPTNDDLSTVWRFIKKKLTPTPGQRHNFVDHKLLTLVTLEICHEAGVGVRFVLIKRHTVDKSQKKSYPHPRLFPNFG